MKIKLLILTALLPFICFSQNRYISNGGSNSNNGLTTATSWLTMEKARTTGQSGGIGPGDTVFFKRGDTFFCADRFNGMTWWGSPTGSSPSGTSGHPIVFSAYGTGAAPNCLFPNPASTDSTSTRVMSFEGVQFIVVENLQFNDTRRANTKLGAAWTGAGVVFGERGSGQETYRCRVSNCYFNNVGLGVVIVGGTDSVTHCTMENFGNVDAIGSDSYGANGITWSGNNCYFAYNTISGAWAYSSAFGLNGGALEAYNTCDTNTIIYNTFWDCGAVCEFGAQNAASTCKFNLFAYNLCSNNGNTSYVNVSGPFTITPTNNRFYNNTIIENRQSRYSGLNYGDGIDTFPSWPTLPSRETHTFQNNGSPSANPVWNVQNNIFYNTNQMNIYSSSGIFNHLSNLYFLKSGSSLGYTIDASELSTSGQVFLDTTATNPINWNVHIPSLLVTGQNLGLTPDFVGQSVSPPVSPGIYQRIGAAITNVFITPGVVKTGSTYHTISTIKTN